MSSLLRLALLVLLIVATLWVADLTLFNWWLSWGPPSPNPQEYARRANLYAVATLLLFVATVALGVFNWKRRARGGRDANI
ncbi:MAG: hypothetical protein FD180_1532 [Planctomycetota bacterium]|nr:MAG: hypothetical protein FD180_1532 [Planctomycetota bacterium]